MANELKFRDLTKEEVEVKKAKGGTLLLYKTARVDANILDETVGIPNWQKLYECFENKVYCKIGIKIDNEWVWKMDAGEETAVEATKGEASDAMKRAGFAWGIGRKLYKSPRIADPDPSNKYARYKVYHIAFDDKSVSELVITNEKNAIIFEYPQGIYAKRFGDARQMSQVDIAKNYLNSNPAALRYYIDKYNANHADDEDFSPVNSTDGWNDGTWLGVYQSLKKGGKVA